MPQVLVVRKGGALVTRRTVTEPVPVFVRVSTSDALWPELTWPNSSRLPLWIRLMDSVPGPVP